MEGCGVKLPTHTLLGLSTGYHDFLEYWLPSLCLCNQNSKKSWYPYDNPTKVWVNSYNPMLRNITPRAVFPTFLKVSVTSFMEGFEVKLP